jgi:hypothetical protein
MLRSTISSRIEQFDLSRNATDTDVYLVPLTGGNSYTFSANAGVSLSDTLDSVTIKLLDTNGNILDEKFGSNPTIYRPEYGNSTSVYYLSIAASIVGSSTNAAASDKTGQYQITVIDPPPKYPKQ